MCVDTWPKGKTVAIVIYFVLSIPANSEKKSALFSKSFRREAGVWKGK